VRLEGGEDFPEGSEATVRVIGPDGEVQDVRLERVGSKAFAGELAVTAAGSYAVTASVSGGDSGGEGGGGEAATSTALASLSYSPEYAPGAADPPLLRRVSELTGGRGEISPDAAFDPDGLDAGRSRVSLARWFLLAAALLWPIAVALSRLALRGTVTAQAGYAGATAVWWLRQRLPSPPSLPGLPGRKAPEPRAPAPSAVDPPPKPQRPARPERPPEDEREKREREAPVATLGSLLASQRRRRSGDTDDPDA